MPIGFSAMNLIFIKAKRRTRERDSIEDKREHVRYFPSPASEHHEES